MNISIITITFNNFSELIDTLKSTESLKCERVVVNGGSCIKTKEFLDSRKDIISISEKDNGIADAFNKGIKLSTKQGIWFLNSGDICIDKDFVSFASQEIEHHDFIYSNIMYDSLIYGNITLKSHPNKPLGLGMIYPHPGMIINKTVFEKLGPFKSDYKIAMDFELVCRMTKSKMLGKYYPHAVTLMDGKGASSTNIKKAHDEDGKALKENNLMTPINYICYQYRTLKLFLRGWAVKLNLLKYYQSFKKFLIN